MQRPRCSTKLPKIRRSTVPMRRARSMPMRAMEFLPPCYTPARRRGDHMSAASRRLTRRRFVQGTAAVAATLARPPRRASAQAKPTITYWNGLTGADGKIMDELIDRFTKETGIRMEQQRMHPAAALAAGPRRARDL